MLVAVGARGADVVFENVTKIYAGGEESPALDRIDLHIAAGEFVAITGPSGCGKSTLLHLAGGIDLASSGRVRVGGRDLARLSEREMTLYRRRSVGTIFQFFNLIPALTVRENVEIPLSLDASPEAASRARDLLDRVGLSRKESAYPYELSGGQMQRVAVARALSARPSLLLADEPTGNLDSAAGTVVLDLLDTLRREDGITVILATHSPEAAARAERAVRLRDGRVS
jgi:ABC-type lipoprotein export system ATPase subunit